MAKTNPNFSIDLDLLEKEIEAKEHENREKIYSELSGQISGSKPTNSSHNYTNNINYDTDFCTLDEPVWVTIKRDLRLMSEKFNKVLLPMTKEKNVIRDWDLWGPIFICVALSLILQKDSSTGPQFTQVFSLAFFGSFVVTLNIKLLSGKISFFQALCVIGYCLLPDVFAAIACKFLSLMFNKTPKLALLLRLCAISSGFMWSIYASMSFLTGIHAENKKLLGIYPLILFYFIVSWLVLSNS